MRSYYRSKLNKLLELARDEEFIQLLWATDALQSQHADAARKFIRPETIPDGAITTKVASKYIQKWEIETLANELMTVPKIKSARRGKIRILDSDNYNVSIICANLLRKLEDAEYRAQKSREDIFTEMGRIAARQFDWQRGFVNIPQLYRYAFVYGQGECAAYFERTYGIALNRFSQIGFMIFSSLTNFPVVRNGNHWLDLDVTCKEFEQVLALIAMPFPVAAKWAQKERKKMVHTADKPSILRQSPCLRFGAKGERIRAPLPELILERVTSGVFYDVIGGGGAIRDDYGKRFEEYCARYIRDALPGLRWEREFKYKKKPCELDTPDIICSEAGNVIMAFECKATRMSQEAMFGKDPMSARGYLDLTKAVYQLWRFFSHCRRGHVKRNIDDQAVGIVLTLDNWLVLAETFRKRILEDAAKMANEKEPEITEADRRPVIFVAVAELERVLSAATEKTFREAVIKSATDKFLGWRLDSVMKELLGDTVPEKRGYPYADDLGTLLPWWDEINPTKAT